MAGGDGALIQENQRGSALLDRAITVDDMKNRRMMETATSYQSFKGIVPSRIFH